MSYGVGAYKKTSVQTASKEQVLLMLYQAAIKNCKKAIDAISNNEIAKKGEYIGKLQDIVIELNTSLDFKVGGEVAKDLSSLYDYVLFASTQANLKMETAPLESCLNILNILYSGWTDAVKTVQKEKTVNPSNPNERKA